MDADGGKSTRLKEKDALDMFGLLQAIETEILIRGIHRHFAADHAGKVTIRGLRAMETYGVDSRSPLPALAARAAAGDATIAPSFVALTKDLLNAVDMIR